MNKIDAPSPAPVARKPPKKTKDRFYSFKVVSYASIEEMSEVFEQCHHYIYIFHDKDDDVDPHFHLLLTFNQQKSFESVRRLFVSEQNTFTQPLEDWCGDFEYLTHKNDPDKYQYSEDCLVSDNLSFWYSKAGSSKPTIDDTFVEDLLTPGTLNLRMMAKKYGRDFIRNYRSYMSFRDTVFAEEEAIRRSFDYVKDHIREETEKAVAAGELPF